MIGYEIDPLKIRTKDEIWRNVLRQNDPVAPPAAADLAVLEQRILARIDASPGYIMDSAIPSAPWALGGSWAMRGACFAAVLFVLLGYIVGRDFDDLSFQATDSNTLFASADGTPWQSFITAPSSGETDDAAQ